MIETLISDKEKNDLRKLFDRFDTNMSGQIDREELTIGLKKMGVADVKQ